MKETGMLHVQTGFVIIYQPRKVVWNIILIEKIACKKSILQHQSLNCACADNAMQLKKWSVIIIKNPTVNSKHYCCNKKYRDLACTRTWKNGLMIFSQKQILLLLTLLSAQESQFQQAWKPQICFASHCPCTLLGVSGPQCRLLSLILLLLEIFLTTLIIDWFDWSLTLDLSDQPVLPKGRCP